jgi:hypothetical protein
MRNYYFFFSFLFIFIYFSLVKKLFRKAGGTIRQRAHTSFALKFTFFTLIKFFLYLKKNEENFININVIFFFFKYFKIYKLITLLLIIMYPLSSLHTT